MGVRRTCLEFDFGSYVNT